MNDTLAQRPRPSRAAFPYLVLLLSLLITFMGVLIVRRAADEQDRGYFESEVQRTRIGLQTRLETHLALLRAGAGFFAAKGTVQRDEFHRFAEQLHIRTNYRGMQGLGYSTRVVPEKVDSLVAKMRSEGRPSFRIWPQGRRDEYQAIIYLEPVDRRNRAAFGFDMYSDPVLRAAMQKARDSGTGTASGKVDLIQQIDGERQPGLIFYFPVYDGGTTPISVEERREKLMGFVFIPLRAEDLLQGIAGGNSSRTVDVKVYDSSTPREERLLYDTATTRPTLSSKTSSSYEAQSQMVVSGRIWTLVFQNRPQVFGSEPGRMLVPWAIVVGVLVSLLLFFNSRSQIRARSDEERAAEELRRSEQQLRDQTETLEAVNRISRILSAELELQRLVQAVTDAATSLARAEFGIFLYNVNRGEDLYDSFAVSGISREAFRSAPPDTAVFGPTFREGIVRVDDITKDRRYETAAPFHGIRYEQDKVRSYMAIPVVSRSGEIVGGLFFGHSQEGVFSEREERIVESLAAQAAVAVDNARLYEAAQRDRRTAEEANRAKDDFLATLSHELRTPMTAILGWSTLIETTELDKETLDTAIEAIRRSSQAQAQLIDDLLDVSRIAAGKVRLDLKRVDLGPVVEAAIGAARPTAESKRIRLESVIPASPTMIHGDAGRLQQIIWNLLSNALKFENEDGRVIVRLSRSEEDAFIEVQDFGLGIDPEFVPHMFKKFRQADASSTRAKGGLGLGLSIVKHLTDLHQGTIEVRSEGNGKGSTFLISIPLLADDEESLKALPAASSDAPRSLAGRNIVVVDDERDVRQFVAVVLEQAGASVRQAGSAHEAMELMYERTPDVLVSDIAMPGEDGLSMIQRIRSSARLRELPALALTAYARPEEQERIVRAGFQKYLQKPVEPSVIIAAVIALLGEQGSEQET